MQAFILYYYYWHFMIVYNVIMQIFYENKSCLFEKILCCPKRKKYFGVMNFQDFGLRLLLPLRPTQWRIALRKNCL